MPCVECLSASRLESFCLLAPVYKIPVRKELIDAAGGLSSQEREDITASAQHALRLIAFRQVSVLLFFAASLYDSGLLLRFRFTRFSTWEPLPIPGAGPKKQLKRRRSEVEEGVDEAAGEKKKASESISSTAAATPGLAANA